MKMSRSILVATNHRFSQALCSTLWTLFLSLTLTLLSMGQTAPTQAPGQTPKTAPQIEEILPSYEGQNVSSVELAGRPDVNTEKFLPMLAIRQGQPFARAKVDQSVAALKKTGQFHDVLIEVRPEPEGIRVLFVLQPAMYFGIYEFPGATSRFQYSRLVQISNYPPRGAYSSVDVQQARDALQTFFRRSGFFLAKVEPVVQTDTQHGLANVIFHITLGRRAKFGQVIVKGTTPQESEHLQRTLHSSMARLRGSAIRRGKTYKLGTVQRATQYLQGQLTKQDRLAAEVKLIGANYNPQTNRADVSFQVQPGPLVHVKVQGAHLWSWTRQRLLPIYQQVGINPEVIQEGRQNLISHFQSKGYFDVKVTTQTIQQQPSEQTIVYQITKGPRHKVAEVAVKGNQHFSDKELLSHVAVNKSHFLSRGKYSEKLVRSSVKNLTGVYTAAGFSEVKVTPQVTMRNGNIAAKFQIEEGPQDIVEALRIEGNEHLSEQQLAPRGLKVTPGQPYSQKAVDVDRNNIIARYLELGFLTTTFRQTVRPVPKQPHRVEVVYLIREGPQVSISTVATLGNKETQPKLINRVTASLQPGHPLKENDMLSSESELYSLGVFDWAEIDPRRRITTQTHDDVLIKVHESRRNSITYGFGFEVVNRGGSVPSGTVAVPGLPPVGLPSTFKTSEKTFYGPRGTFEYMRKNVLGKGASLTFSGLAGRLDQRGSINYIDPMFRWTNWSSNLSVSGEHNSQNPIFSSRQAQYGFQLQRPLNKDKTQNLFLRYSLSQTGLTRLLIPALVPAEDQHVRLSTFSGTYIRDTRDNALDAHKGIYESFEASITPSALGSNVNFAKLLAQSAYYKQIPLGIIWANSLRIGLEQPFAGSHVPLSERFFSGGGSTLRGFPLNGAGPQRTIPACGDPSDTSTCSRITVPVGGNQLLIINSELRIPVPLKKGLGVVAFYDGGNVYDRIGFHNFGANYTNTIGTGIRYATPVGPVRIDIGHNLNALPGIKATQIFITLGQAF
jgi:outer membrane protein insertion porin family